MNNLELAIDVVATLISEKTTIEQKMAASILMNKFTQSMSNIRSRVYN